MITLSRNFKLEARPPNMVGTRYPTLPTGVATGMGRHVMWGVLVYSETAGGWLDTSLFK